MGVIEKIIAEDQELRGNGRWLRGSTNDSLVVDTEKQLFYFNSKDISGNSFTWLTKIKGLPPNIAKEILATYREGLVPLNLVRTKKDKFVVAFEKLVDVFHNNYLRDGSDYWSNRGISNATIKRFKLGLK